MEKDRLERLEQQVRALEDISAIKPLNTATCAPAIARSRMWCATAWIRMAR